MSQSNLDFNHYTFENEVDPSSLKSFFIAVLLHATVICFAGFLGFEKVSYGVGQASRSSVSVELFAAGPSSSVAEQPQLQEIEKVVDDLPEVVKIKEAEFVLPKKIKEKPKTVKKVIPVIKKEPASNDSKASEVKNDQNNLAANAVGTSGSSGAIKSEASGQGQSNGNGGIGDKVTDLQAAYLRNPPPSYPQASRVAKEEGLVLLLVSISASGEVSDISVKQTSGFYRLDRAALHSVNDWKFKPTKIAGVPIDDQVIVPIKFELKSN